MAAAATRQGFTLIELMISLVIAAVLLLIGLPSLAEFLRNSQIRSVTESLVNGLRVARTEATSRNLQVRFTLLGSGSDWAGWSVDQVSPAQNIQSYSRSEGGTSTAVTPTAGTSSVTFNGVGRICPKNDAVICTPAVATDNIQQLDISSTATSGTSRSLRIVLPNLDTATQGIRVCDPNMPVTVPPDARAC